MEGVVVVVDERKKKRKEIKWRNLGKDNAEEQRRCSWMRAYATCAIVCV